MTVDFPFYEPVAIGNVLFLDNGNGTGTANNGIQDGTEPSVPAGVKVELYTGADVLVTDTVTDSNGRYYFDNLVEGEYYVKVPASEFRSGPDGIAVATTTTDTDGNYSFTDLAPGDYVAVEIQPEGLLNVTENEGGIDNDKPDNLTPTSIAGTVDAGETDINNDFVEEELGSWSGDVGKDTDNDDMSDENLPNVSIELFTIPMVMAILLMALLSVRQRLIAMVTIVLMSFHQVIMLLSKRNPMVFRVSMKMKVEMTMINLTIALSILFSVSSMRAKMTIKMISLRRNQSVSGQQSSLIIMMGFKAQVKKGFSD